jgi:hypothetical protein
MAAGRAIDHYECHDHREPAPDIAFQPDIEDGPAATTMATGLSSMP